MNGDDITCGDAGLPIFPKGTPLWDRIRCVLGYHKPEVRIAPRRRHRHTGQEIGPSRMRDQCGRCDTYLNDSIPLSMAKQMVEHDHPHHEWIGGPALPPKRDDII